MPDRTNLSLRLVVQRVRMSSGHFGYRLIAYSNARNYPSQEFVRLELLLNSLRSAIPNFYWTALTGDEADAQSQVVFSGDFELSDEQLKSLQLV